MGKFEKRLDNLIKTLTLIPLDDDPTKRFNQRKIATFVRKFEEGKGIGPPAFSEELLARIKNEENEEKILAIIKRIEDAFQGIVEYNKKSSIYDPLVPTIQDLDFTIEVIPEKIMAPAFFVGRQAQGKRNVKVIDTWIHYFSTADMHNLDGLLKERDTIKILVLHPFCDALYLRAESLNRKIRDVQDELLNNLSAILSRASDLKIEDRVEIRWYEDVPSVHAFILDDEVYFGHYFSNKYSTDACFYHVKNKNSVFNTINDNFDRLWAKYNEEIDLNWIDKMRVTLGNKEKQFSRLSEAYMMYNLDDFKQDVRFQTSVLFLDTNRSKVRLISWDRDGGVLKQFGKIQYVGEGNILFSFKKGGFFLDILTPSLDQDHEVIQAIYLHNDAKKLPKSSFALLIPETREHCEEKITDNTQDVEPFIRNYLRKDRVNILRFSKRKSKKDEIVPKNAEAIEMLHNLVGTWYLYYPVRSGVENMDSIINPVGKGIFTIASNPETGGYKARLESHDKRLLEGNIQVYGSNEKYINCTNLTDNNNNVVLNLLIRIGSINSDRTESRLPGVYNIKYGDGTTGCGLVVMKRVYLDDNSRIATFEADYETLQAENIPTHLIFKDKASIISFKEYKKTFNYAGLYKIYTIQRVDKQGDSRKCLVTSVMRIYKNRLVEFRGGFPHASAEGRVRIILSNMFIDLKNSSDESGASKERLGTFIVKIAEGKPALNSYYIGTFNGLSRRNWLPMAKKVVIEYIGNLDNENDFINFQPDEIDICDLSKLKANVPSAIAKTLIGQYGNFIGFHDHTVANLSDLTRLNAKEPDMPLIFLDAAIHRALSPLVDFNGVMEALKLAASHGMLDMERFKDAIKDAPHCESILKKIEDSQFFNVDRVQIDQLARKTAKR